MGHGGTVLSATSLWPLLAFPALAADGPARSELEDAIGLPAAEAAFDRPLGFPTVHRTSRLVMAAGWVAEPVPFPEYGGNHDGDGPDEAQDAAGKGAVA